MQHSRLLSSDRASSVRNRHRPTSILTLSHSRASFHAAVVIWVPQQPLVRPM